MKLYAGHGIQDMYDGMVMCFLSFVVALKNGA